MRRTVGAERLELCSAPVNVSLSPDEGGGATRGRGVWFCVPSRPGWSDRRGEGLQLRFSRALHVPAAERGGERAAGRPREGRPDGEGAEGDAGGRGAVEEVSAHHQ